MTAIPRPLAWRQAPALPMQVASAAVLLGAAIGGLLVAEQPRLVAGAVITVLALVFAVRAPVAHLLTMLAVTVIVPLSVQSQFGSGGSADAAGLIPSDLLLLGGLLRIGLTLAHEPLDRRSTRMLLVVAAIAGITMVQAVHAVALGRPPSGLGSEVRTLLAIVVFAMAVPLLQDAAARRRLLVGLVGLGVALGAWGVLQSVLHLTFDAASDQAASSSRDFTTAGRTVGMYTFPVAALGGLAILAVGALRTTGAKLVVVTMVVLNLVALMLTYERTFYGALAAGFVLLLVRLRHGQRLRLVGAAVAVSVVAVATLAAAKPALLTATADRLSSVTKYQSDPSVNYRVVESREVMGQIRAHPVAGNGLGAYIMIGRPGTLRPPTQRRYAENGYLWIAWKLGVAGLVAVVALLALGMAARAPAASAGPSLHGVRAGAQAGIASLAVASMFFGSFANLSVIPVLGLLAALSTITWEIE